MPCHWVVATITMPNRGGQPAHDALRTSCWLLAVGFSLDQNYLFSQHPNPSISFSTPYCEDKLSSTVGNCLSILIGSEAGKLYTWPQLQQLSRFLSSSLKGAPLRVRHFFIIHFSFSLFLLSPVGVSISSCPHRQPWLARLASRAHAQNTPPCALPPGMWPTSELSS